MKLSEAMMLGDIALTRSSTTWLDRSAGCGCAIGRAYAVVGGNAFSPSIADFTPLWPWLGFDELIDISDLFSAVTAAQMTFEQLVDFVRSIEPSCGECNKFECSCAKTEVEQPASKGVTA